MIEFTLNGETVSTDSAPDTPLLWVIRDELKLKAPSSAAVFAATGKRVRDLPIRL